MEARRLVGWNVRKLRVARGLTLEDVADKVGSSASYVAQLERGEVNVGIMLLAKLAIALDAGLADLTEEPLPGERAPSPLRAGRKAKRATPRKRPS